MPSASFSLCVVTTTGEKISCTCRKSASRKLWTNTTTRQLESYGLFRALWGKQAPTILDRPASHKYVMEFAPLIKPLVIDFFQMILVSEMENAAVEIASPTKQSSKKVEPVSPTGVDSSKLGGSLLSVLLLLLSAAPSSTRSSNV